MRKKIMVWSAFAVLVTALLLGSFLAGRAFSRTVPVQAMGDVSDDLSAVIQASSYCVVNNVAAFDTRIHIRCNDYVDVGGDHVYYFAYSTDPVNIDTANQILAIGNTAMAMNYGVWMYFYTDTAHNPPGCNASDCRGLWGVSMVK